MSSASAASERAASTYQAARALIIAALVEAAIISVMGVNYIARAISNPLLDLSKRMRALAGNDTHIEIDGVNRRDEIGEMARAVVVFRNNAIELALSQEGLVQQAGMLEERLDHERQLTALQRNFVSMASHEFRTPLTVINGHAQRLIAMKARLTPEDIADRAVRIRRAVQSMTHVIDSLLSSSRIFDSEPGLYFHPTSIDLSELLHDVCKLHREISPSAHIIENLAQAPRAFQGDAKLLHQVFSNLLSNAVKYSPGGGRIELSAKTEGDQVVVTVSDHGVGIPEADLANVFERYHRGGNVSGIVGTGIGLYLVKIVARLHGGSVGVSSQEGQGSRFEVRLPAVAGRDAAQAT